MLLAIAAVFGCFGLISSFYSVLAKQRGMRTAPYLAVTVLAFTVAGVLSVLAGSEINACGNAMVAALHAYLWWNGDGGNGTKRRLKKWASRFHGIRRTAPSPT